MAKHSPEAQTGRSDSSAGFSLATVVSCYEAMSCYSKTSKDYVIAGSQIDFATAPSPYPAHHREVQGSGTTERDPKFIALVKSEAFKAVVSDIKEQGINGAAIRAAVADAMSKNQVLAFGEFHDNPNPFREFGASIMGALAQSGATHLVIEAHDPKLAAAITEFNRTGDLGKLKSAYPESVRDHESYFGMLQAAREAGLTIVAGDNPDAAWQSSDRDAAMSKTVTDILREPNQKDLSRPNKVVLWTGAFHLSDAQNSAANRLRREGVQISTMEGVIPSMRTGLQAAPIAYILPDLNRPTLVATKTAPGLRSIPNDFGSSITGDTAGDYNYLLFFPKEQ